MSDLTGYPKNKGDKRTRLGQLEAFGSRQGVQRTLAEEREHFLSLNAEERQKFLADLPRGPRRALLKAVRKS